MRTSLRLFLLGIAFLLSAEVLRSAEKPSPPAQPSPAQESLIHDFENEDLLDLTNRLGGESGSWNLDPMDENNSYTDADIVKIPGPDGAITQALKLTYSVESEVPAQNGFWTKLRNFDASGYDHLSFEVRGDPEKGFTERFYVQLKKYKGEEKVEKIKGSKEVRVSDAWQTVKIPLHHLTGLIDFANPEHWKNPALALKDLDEFVIVFHDRHVTQKKGSLYLDNFRFVRTGEPGPTAVDFPPRKGEKTPVRLEGLEFAKFLIGRLGGFPDKTVVRKEFPEDDRAFLKEIARDTWRYFEEVVDKEHGLPLDTIQMAQGEDAVGEGTWIGDYTNVTNIGVYLMCLVSAYDLGFVTREEAIARIRRTLDTLEKLEHHESGFPYNYYDTTTAERTSYFVSLVDSGWLYAGFYVVKNAFPEELASQAERLLARGNFSFFYHPVERQMFHGFYENLGVYSDYHYGVFYTEPRASSLIAIARGEVPEEHWFLGMTRTFPPSYDWQQQTPQNRRERATLGFKYPGGHYRWRGLEYVPSWGGSSFEALMPTLILKEKQLAPEGLGLNNERHVEGQIRYALEELGYPVWGMSPSSVPEGGYSEYGATPFGSRGYKAGVVTPHASVLALEYAPREVVANLRKLLELYDIYGEYGFYDAVNVETGLVARKYLALDQGMILVAINNYLNPGAIRERFHAEPIIRQVEKLLSSEKFFEAGGEASDDAPA